MNLNKRLPTALVLLAIVFCVIQYSSRWMFFIVVQITVLASLYEFYSLSRKARIFPRKVLGTFIALIIGVAFYFEMVSIEFVLFTGLLLAGIYFVLSITRLEKMPNFSESFALTFFGAFYLSFTLNYFNFLRDEWGPLYIYFLLTLIFLGDTGAYFFGKLFGRHKMAPMASPKKTWEGSFGGILFACLGAVAVQQILLKDLVLWKAVLFAVLIHSVAQLSDALESLFKRAVGVKDSSNALPGHGGFLDRVDSLILAAPFFYYLLKYLGMT